MEASNAPSRQRSYWLDNAKAITMVMVVIMHVALSPLYDSSDYIKILYKFINFIIMPCFMILSGYLSKNRINNRRYNVAITRLFIPYLIAQFAMYLLYCFTGTQSIFFVVSGTSQMFWLRPTQALWYLLAMFVYQMLTPSIVHNKKPWAVLLVAGLCSLAIGFAPYIGYLSVNMLVGHYPFFLFGYFLKEKSLVALKKKRFQIGGAVIIIGLILLCVFGYQDIYHRFIPVFMNPYSSYDSLYFPGYGLLCRFLYLFAAVAVSLSLISLTPKRKTFFSYIGQHSIYVYILHVFVYMALRIANVYLDGAFFGKINSGLEYIIFIVLAIALAVILASKPVRYLTRPLIEPNIDMGLLGKRIFASKPSPNPLEEKENSQEKLASADVHTNDPSE